MEYGQKPFKRGNDSVVIPSNPDQNEEFSEGSKSRIKKYLWIIPGIVAFLIALIPTLTNQWPLTVDIFVHVRAAEVFSHYGLTFIDPLINPPSGSPINSPPLFSLLIMFIGNMLKIDYFQAARLLQPFLALSVVLSVSYVAKKFYGGVAGISAGFLVMSSYLFTRLVSPLPETMAIIFVPLAIYLFYQAIMTKKYRYALMSSFLFLLVIATHQATTNLLFLIITAITIVLVIIKREKFILKFYGLFLSIPLITAVIVGISLVIVAPNLAQHLFTYGITLIKTSVPYNDPISNAKYLVYLGIVMIFVIIGSIVAVKRRNTKDIFIIVWIIVLFLMSKSYWFGINVYTIRLLLHLLLPLSILGGVGLSYLYLNFKKTEFPSKNIRTIFLITIFLITTLFAIVTVTDTNFEIIPQYNTQPYGSSELIIPQIAPPTNSSIELSNWFKEYGDNKSAILSNNYATNQFLLATTSQPIIDVSTSARIIQGGFNISKLAQKGIGYFVFDKRLVFSSNSSKKIINQGFIYTNKNYSITSILPANAKLLYENQDYMVFKI